MKFTVGRDNLEAAFSMVSDCTTGQGATLTAHVLFRPTVAGGYELLAMNQRNFGCSALEGTTIDGDAVPFTVEAKRLSAWLKAVAANTDITFTVDGGKVTASTKRGKAVFSSLDPAQFPFWDAKLAEAKVVTKVSASRLGDIIRHAKHFVSDQEHRMPHLCVIQAQGGSLFSTDQTAVTMITSPILKDCSFRIHFRDVGAVVNFLSKAGDADVEILEHDNFCVMRRNDQTLVGATRFTANFPTLAIDRNAVDQQWWIVPKSDLLSSIQYVSASADWEDKRVSLSRQGQKLILTMKAAAGDPTDVEIQIGALEVPEGANSKVEFALSSEHLTKVLSVVGSDQVKLGINQHNKTGWIRFREERDGDDYLTILTWMN